MEDRLTESWNAFPEEIAKRYLKTFGSPSEDSRRTMADILSKLSRQVRNKDRTLRILDVGCGNGNFAEYLASRALRFSYVGVDFSDVLLKAALVAYPQGKFIHDDVNELAEVKANFDVVCYSHVIEMLSSPEASLQAAATLAPKIIIRFFEPPIERPDRVDLLEMDVGTGTGVPYLRRKMSIDYYRLILHKIGCHAVDVYRSTSNDQIHVLHLKKNK